MIEFKITGATKAEVEKKTEEYYGLYNPWGYGTMIQAPVKLEDGTWEAKGSRASSCD